MHAYDTCVPDVCRDARLVQLLTVSCEKALSESRQGTAHIPPIESQNLVTKVPYVSIGLSFSYMLLCDLYKLVKADPAIQLHLVSVARRILM